MARIWESERISITPTIPHTAILNPSTPIQTICLGAACQAIAYCIQVAKPPFPLMAVAYAINGFGEALQDAQANGLVATLPTNANGKMSILHGVYGAGAFCAPLVATQFASMKGNWSLHFLTSLGLAIINLAVLLWVSKLKTQEGSLQPIKTMGWCRNV